MLTNQFNKVSIPPEYLPNSSQDTESTFRLGTRIMFFRLVWIEEHNLYSHCFKVWI